MALYQSGRLFGANSGIYYYGEVLQTGLVKRSDIKEIPKNSDELYYRFEIKEWKKLPKHIAQKEFGFVRAFTNLFLLEHSAEIPELWLRSEAEYRLYNELKRSLNSTEINDDSDLGFRFGDALIAFDSGDILVYKQDKLTAKYAVRDFVRHPNSVFRRMQQEIQN